MKLQRSNEVFSSNMITLRHLEPSAPNPTHVHGCAGTSDLSRGYRGMEGIHTIDPKAKSLDDCQERLTELAASWKICGSWRAVLASGTEDYRANSGKVETFCAMFSKVPHRVGSVLDKFVFLDPWRAKL